MHTSVAVTDSMCEVINVVPVNPLISKCQIKVCYVGEDPNRNGTIITKNVAKQIANSLPGSPIVGFYNKTKEDFESHNKIIDLSDSKFDIVETTKPYGFVDLNAKVWFQKFLDDGVEHEYLMTEGFLWTEAYPESKRILEKGNNQSMTLDEKTVRGSWTNDKNGMPQFFIINEAFIKNLCILGENVEPCFEGAQITKVQFSFDDDFQNSLLEMMKQMQEILNKGGTQMFSIYKVEIGDALWTSLYAHLNEQYASDNEVYNSLYRIDGVYEDQGVCFAALENQEDNKYYRIDIQKSENDEYSFSTLAEFVDEYVKAEEAQFATDAYENYGVEFKRNKKKDDEEEDENNNNDDPKEDPKSDPKEEEEEEEDEDEKKKKKQGKKNQYNLNEIPEYMELTNNYNDLEHRYNELSAEYETLKATNKELTAFKAKIEKAEKEKMIDSFYMLSDEDKKDVITNIDTYSLDDIEAKLSIICVRNKVSFDDAQNERKDPTTYSLNNNDFQDSVPAWVKSLKTVAQDMR